MGEGFKPPAPPPHPPNPDADLSGCRPLWTEAMTHAGENITLSQNSYALGKIESSFPMVFT